MGFALHRLDAGEAVAAETGGREVCLVLVSGKARLAIDGKDYGEIGGRMSPFDGAPWAAYAPAGGRYSVVATTQLELAVCSAPGGRGLSGQADPAGRASADRARQGVQHALCHQHHAGGRRVGQRAARRRGDHAGRQHLVLPSAQARPRRPPDRELPRRDLLSPLQPAAGYGFQRVYTDDRSLDETVLIEDGDVVMVPKGYHPVATLHGYESYYLNVMAGPKRVWKFHNEPAHEWLFTGVGAPANAKKYCVTRALVANGATCRPRGVAKAGDLRRRSRAASAPQSGRGGPAPQPSPGQAAEGAETAPPTPSPACSRSEKTSGRPEWKKRASGLQAKRASATGQRAVPGADGLLGVGLGEPRRGHILGLGEEDEAVAAHAVQVAEERLLVAGEAEDAERNRNADVDPHHAAVGAPGELARIVAAFGVDHEPLAKRLAFMIARPSSKSFDPLDAQHRAEDLLVAHVHPRLTWSRMVGPTKKPPS